MSIKSLIISCKLLVIILVTLFSSSSVYAADSANLKRFGVGWGYLSADYNLYKPVVFDLGIGWITNWSYKNIPPKLLKELVSAGMDNMPLVLGKRGEEFSAQKCTELINYVSANPDAFPVEKTYWSVGNELGYDPGDMTANKYATEFISWRDCIKSINSNYKVGSGAITSMWVVLPRTYPISCTEKDAANSGKTYFNTYVNRIKSLNSSKLPDFFVMHAYNTCHPVLPGETTEFSKFKNAVISYRQVMKELGLQNKELWIKEFNSGAYDSGFIDNSLEYVLNAKDTDIGYPGDSYRLVQRFAWFMLKNTPGGMNSTPNVLANTTGGLTAQGLRFRAISRKYAGSPLQPPSTTPSPSASCQTGEWQNGACSTGSCGVGQRLQTRSVNPLNCTRATRCIADAACGPTPTRAPNATPTQTPAPTNPPTSTPTPAPVKGDATGDRLVTISDYAIWKTNYGKSASAWPTGAMSGNFNADSVVDGVDYAIWFRNFKKTN